MNHNRDREPEGESEYSPFEKEVLAYLNEIQDGLTALTDKVDTARRTAKRRSNEERGRDIMLKKEFYEKLVALQTSNKDGVAAISNLVTKFIEEVRKAHDDSGEPIPAEVESVLAGFEANNGALAAATAAGTAAFPADLPIPPVVEPPVGGSEAGAVEET